MPLGLLTAVLLSTVQPASAETTWRDCVDKTTTNMEWGACSGDYIRSADQALNAAWKQLMAAAQGQTKADLIAEEKAWIAYRETACKFYLNGDYGREGQVLHGPACIASLIEKRTTELNAYLTFISPK